MKVNFSNVSNPNLEKERHSIIKFLKENGFKLEDKFWNMRGVNYWIFYDISLKNILKILILFSLSKKIIYYCHEPNKKIADIFDYSLSEKLKSLLLNIVNPVIFYCAHKIITLSPLGTSKMSARWKTKLIESRIIIEDVKQVSKGIEYDVCWLGRCTRQKGFDQFVRFVNTSPILNVCICTNDDRDSIEKLFTRTNLTIEKYKNEYSATVLLSKSKFVAVMHRKLTQSGVAVQALRSDCYLLSDSKELKFTYRDFNVVLDTKSYVRDFTSLKFKDGEPRRVYLTTHHPNCHEFLLDILI